MFNASRRHLMLTSLGATIAASCGLARAASTLDWVDPELRSALAPMLAPSPFANLPPAQMINALRHARFGPDPTPLASVPYQRRLIASGSAAPMIPLYIINARAGAHRPAILHTHGGGFILGSAESDLIDLQKTAQALDCVIVSVDYRLAPETRYHGSIADNYAGLCWLADHGAELGADTTRIALMGESAGGGHAALLALKARDDGPVKPIFQMLIYPMLDDRTGGSIMPKAHEGGVLWSPAMNRLGWSSFLGMPPGGPGVPAAAVPARRGDLAGLPKCFIGVGSIDLFVDEDLEYGRRLIDAGVETELVVVPGAYHGFDGIAPQAGVSRRFEAARLTALRRAFSITSA